MNTPTTSHDTRLAPVARFYSLTTERRPGHGWGRVAAGLALLIVGIVLVTVVAGIVIGAGAATDPETGDAIKTAKASPLKTVFRMGTPVALWGVVVFLVARFVFSFKLADLISSVGKIRWSLLVKCLAIAFTGFGVYYFALMFTSGKEIQLTGPVLAGVVAVILLIPFQAMAEELVFRGFTLQMILGKIGYSTVKFWVVALVIGSIFAAAHGTAGPAAIIGVFGFAVLFALLAWKLAGLEGAFAVHIANNVLLFATGLLQGKDIDGNQQNMQITFGAMALQLLVTAVVTGVIIWVARRENAKAVAA